MALPDRQLNSPEKLQKGYGSHSSTTVLCCVWWEKQSYSMRAMAPLRAMKYSFAIRHRALGSIPTASCNKPLRKLLLKTTTQWKACSAELSNSFNYCPHTGQHWFIYCWILAELRTIHKSINTLNISITNLTAVQFTQCFHMTNLANDWLMKGEVCFSHLQTALTTNDWPHRH